jgi:CDP-glucose 4,6-dehydratase
MNLSDAFKGKRVFVTGHTGFKGSWLLTWLYQLGAIVKGYALAPLTARDLYLAINGDTMCESVIADIRDAARLKSELLAFEPDFVFHLAAQPLVRLSYEIPVDTFAINAMGTAHVLEALRSLEKHCTAVMITTDKVYHNREQHYFYNEDDRLGGYDPYSASKATAELIIDSYRKSFFNPSRYSEHGKSISVGRAGNVIGGGDWAVDRIIPDIVRALSEGKPVQVRNPAAVRPWQHVLEPLAGYLTLAARQLENPVDFAGAFNFGPYTADNLTVEAVVKTAIRCWGQGEMHVPDQTGALHEAGLLQLDITKAGEVLQWKPKMLAEQAILFTIEWYREYIAAPGNAAKKTIEQINYFNNK